MYYKESDPLLPRDAPAPEIHGSRAASLKDVGGDDSWAPETRNGLGAEWRRLDGTWLRKTLATVLGWIVAAGLVVTVLSLIVENKVGGRIGEGWDRWRHGSQTIEGRVSRILADTPLIDGHNDLAILIRFLYNNHIYDKNFTDPFENGGFRAHVDLPRLREGKVGGAFWAAFTPCPKEDSFADENYIQSVAWTYNQIDLLNRIQAQYPKDFSTPPNSTTAMTAFKKGQLVSPLAIEGLHQIGNSLSNLRNYYDLGVRYATLTHNCHNKYADAALQELPGGALKKATPRWNGVSPVGQALIHEMNRMGMIVDLAHVSQDTMRDVLAGKGNWTGSIAPPIYSHSSAYSLCPHPRNVPDDILQLVQQRNSLVMVNFSPDFISCVAADNQNGLPDPDPTHATLQHVVEHIMHIGGLIGYDHVGLGSDFDGIPSVPEGLEDVSKFPDLVAALLRSGVSDADAKKVVGGNLLRVWRDVDKVALKMQKEGVLPLEDDLPSLHLYGLEDMMKRYGS